MKSFQRATTHLAAAIVCASLCMVHVAHAQPSSDAALAEQLFLEGQRLMSQGKVSEACPKLAESQRLDPRLGTLLNLATCHEEDGKLALAWSEFMDAAVLADRARRPDRSDFAKAHIAALEKKLARVRISIAPAPAADIAIRLDGKALAVAALETALPIDPGRHTVEASAPGKKPWQGIFDGQAGVESTVRIPALEDAPTELVTATPTTTTPPPNSDRYSARSSSPQRLVGFIVGGVGLAGLAVGSLFGVLAFSKEGDAKDVCPDPACTSQRGVKLHDDARSNALVSTVAFAAGTAFAVGGLVLVLTAPRDNATTPPSAKATTVQLRLRPGGIDVIGAFF